MANLPLFIFSDEGFRSMAGYDVNERLDPIVGFTFVECDSPRHVSDGGEIGHEYRERLKSLKLGLTPASLHFRLKDTGDDTKDGGTQRSPDPKVSQRDAPSETRGDDKPRPIRHVATRLLVGVLRVIEVMVLPPLTWLLQLTARESALQGHLHMKPSNEMSSRRARRWLRFADTAFDQAPGLLVFGVILLVPVLLFGMPDVAAFLWPDWSAIVEGRGAPEAVGPIIFAILSLLIAGSALILVITLQVVGLSGFAAGWVIKPVAAWVGPDLLATFLHNPQEPAWAGAGKETIIQIKVPCGWSALKSTSDADKMNEELSKVRESVRDQLESRKLGKAST